ncbi:LysR family transcriptional regulator [Luteibaculum oceani]|uniref:LysR family transcriptional regulator n=1 Tax=Luteibaculum oceani TaxID=1294296 RepID=A0A5C6V1W9_9FLAO|nr:LysR family transcriptional regulator [Luteibaculum oceani]TXC78691.1 LysR family transcriptional regulator [Luteibaculum oceani]
MHYTLHQLRIFIEVVDCKSITKASQQLHLTQPAVSIQIKKLQEQFEIPLIEVVGKQLYVTDFGFEVANYARKILEYSDQLKYKTQSFRNELGGKIKFSIASTGKYVLPFFLAKFLEKHPGIDTSIDVTNKLNVIRDLEENKVDFALVSTLPKKLEVNAFPLIENKLFLVCKTDMLSKAKAKDKLPLIYRENGSATRNAMIDYFKGKPQNVKSIQLTSNEAVKQAVISGMGKSIMPLIGIKHELKSGDLSIVKVRGLPITTQWNLIYLKEKMLSPAARAYLSFLALNTEKIIEESFKWIKNY